MRARLIPVLLFDRDKRLVKTVRFSERTYVGDPFNVIRLFNEKEVDEICVLDIDASVDGRGPDFEFIRALASECFMPLAYGGGIRTVDHCRKLNREGVEKFVLGSAALDLQLVRGLSAQFGSQAVVGCVDARGSGATAASFVRSGREATRFTALAQALALQQAGAGEVLLQSIDRDGAREGMDLHLLSSVSSRLSVPLIALGGAGSNRHLVEALQAGASAAASGSAFTFIGRLRAVLVSYPEPREMDALLSTTRTR